MHGVQAKHGLRAVPYEDIHDQLQDSTDAECREAYELMSKSLRRRPPSHHRRRPERSSMEKHFVEVRDIIHAYEKRSRKPATFGNTYQIASREPFRWESMTLPRRKTQRTLHQGQPPDHTDLLRVRSFSVATGFRLRSAVVTARHDRRSDRTSAIRRRRDHTN